jgi:hypothetical protein
MMSEDRNDELNETGEDGSSSQGNTPEGVPGTGQAGSFSVSGMYREWFLDYASYVILERAVPALYDGLKPVQRRILHSMKVLDDGRYNKVANIIGHTMQYHPHGDASIGDALVQLGQKDLLIDCQGNWGNTLTGDSAAAPRYIEARLSKFALDVVFNPKTTEWQASYDGRNKEPVFLPVKFPLLLAQGGEGIAVGLSCKVLPHNFNELIDASIAVLRGKNVQAAAGLPHGRPGRCRQLRRRPARRAHPLPGAHPQGGQQDPGDLRDPLRHHHRQPDREHHQGQRQGQDQDPPHRGQHGEPTRRSRYTSRRAFRRTTPSTRSSPSPTAN